MKKLKKLMSAKLNEKTNGSTCKILTTSTTCTSAAAGTDGVSNSNVELISLTSSQEQIVMNDISNIENASFEVLSDGLDELFSNCELPTSATGVPTPAVTACNMRSPLMPYASANNVQTPAVSATTCNMRSPLMPHVPMPNLINCSNITFNFNINNVQK